MGEHVLKCFAGSELNLSWRALSAGSGVEFWEWFYMLVLLDTSSLKKHERLGVHVSLWLCSQAHTCLCACMYAVVSSWEYACANKPSSVLWVRRITLVSLCTQFELMSKLSQHSMGRQSTHTFVEIKQKLSWPPLSPLSINALFKAAIAAPA